MIFCVVVDETGVKKITTFVDFFFAKYELALPIILKIYRSLTTCSIFGATRFAGKLVLNVFNEFSKLHYIQQQKYVEEFD